MPLLKRTAAPSMSPHRGSSLSKRRHPFADSSSSEPEEEKLGVCYEAKTACNTFQPQPSGSDDDRSFDRALQRRRRHGSRQASQLAPSISSAPFLTSPLCEADGAALPHGETPGSRAASPCSSRHPPVSRKLSMRSSETSPAVRPALRRAAPLVEILDFKHQEHPSSHCDSIVEIDMDASTSSITPQTAPSAGSKCCTSPFAATQEASASPSSSESADVTVTCIPMTSATLIYTGPLHGVGEAQHDDCLKAGLQQPDISQKRPVIETALPPRRAEVSLHGLSAASLSTSTRVSPDPRSPATRSCQRGGENGLSLSLPTLRPNQERRPVRSQTHAADSTPATSPVAHSMNAGAKRGPLLLSTPKPYPSENVDTPSTVSVTSSSGSAVIQRPKGIAERFLGGSSSTFVPVAASLVGESNHQPLSSHCVTCGVARKGHASESPQSPLVANLGQESADASHASVVRTSSHSGTSAASARLPLSDSQFSSLSHSSSVPWYDAPTAFPTGNPLERVPPLLAESARERRSNRCPKAPSTDLLGATQTYLAALRGVEPDRWLYATPSAYPARKSSTWRIDSFLQ